MPIKPENRARYPKDWDLRSRFVRFYRAKNHCEWCGCENYKPHPVTGSKVVLTTAHVYDDRPEACSLLNLAALCQRCHNRHDAKARITRRKERRLLMSKDADAFIRLFLNVKLEGSYRLIGGDVYGGKLVSTEAGALDCHGPSMDADIAQIGNHSEHGPCIFIRSLKASKWMYVYCIDRLPREDIKYAVVRKFMGVARFRCREKTSPDYATVEDGGAKNEND